VHLEVSYALAPDVNDTRNEILDVARWISENLGPSTPVHVVGAAPAGRPDLELATLDDRTDACELFREHLEHVYVANDREETHCHTYCPDCGAELVHRTAGEVTLPGLMPRGDCATCGRSGVLRY
jgi:pyruvate formate lyase activating enzyme